MKNFNLTDNITFLEMVHTDISEYSDMNIKEGQKPDILFNIKKTASLIQKIRSHFNSSIVIHSGFRCMDLNLDKRIGGKPNSDHCLGLAVDFHIKNVSLDNVFLWIWRESGILFKQLIHEYHNNKEWIHISYGTDCMVLVYKNNKYERLK